MQANDIRPGMIINFKGDLYSVFSFAHRTPGNLRAFVQVKLRNLRNGSQFEHRFGSTDTVEKVALDDKKMEYLYDDGEYYYFMDVENYEQLHLTKEILGDATDYLIQGLQLNVTFYEGKAMGVDLPPSLDMKVVETEPSLKGATVSNVGKPAKMITGLMVQVPAFITEGETIRVNTADGSYLGRA